MKVIIHFVETFWTPLFLKQRFTEHPSINFKYPKVSEVMHIFPCKTLTSFKVVKICIYFIFFFEMSSSFKLWISHSTDIKSKISWEFSSPHWKKMGKTKSLAIEGTMICGHQGQLHSPSYSLPCPVGLSFSSQKALESDYPCSNSSSSTSRMNNPGQVH